MIHNLWLIDYVQIGPSQFNSRMSGGGHSGGGDSNHQIILESIEELSQDSLDETQVSRNNFFLQKIKFFEIRKQLKKRWADHHPDGPVERQADGRPPESNMHQ